MAWQPDVNELTGQSAGGYTSTRKSRKKKWEPEVNDLTDPGYAEQYEAEQATKTTRDELAKATADKEAEKETVRKQAEEKAKKRSVFEAIGDRFFEANSPEDKAIRKSRGEPELYKDQKNQDKDDSQRLKNLDFSKDDIDTRREHYQRQGVNIDEFISDKVKFDQFTAENKGKSLAKLTLENKIPEEAKRYERDKKNVQKIEGEFQKAKKTGASRDNMAEVIERRLTRGGGAMIAGLPGDVQTLAGTALDVVSPEGSRLDKLAEGTYLAGKSRKERTDQQIIDTGYGIGPNDGIAGNLAEGVGNLGAAVAIAPIAGVTAPTKTKGIAGAVKNFLKPGGVGTVFGTSKAGDMTVEARDAGQSDIGALTRALPAGYAEAVLENFGLGKLFGQKGNAALAFVRQAFIEGAQEAAQDTTTNLIRSTYTDVPADEIISQGIESFLYGMAIGGPAGAVFALSNNVSNKLQEAGVDPELADQAGKAAEEQIKEKLLEKGLDEEVPGTGEAVEPVVEAPVITPPVEAPIVEQPTTPEPTVPEVKTEVAPIERPKGSMKPIKETPGKGRATVTVGGVTDTLGNILGKNIDKTRKKMGDEEADKIGTTYNEGLNQKVIAYQDLRTDKSKEGLEIIGNIFRPSENSKPQLEVYIVDHTEKTLARKVAKEAELERRLAELDKAPVETTTKPKGSMKLGKKAEKSPKETFLETMDTQLKGTALEGAAKGTWGDMDFSRKTGNTETLYKTFDESELEDGDRAAEWKERISKGERPTVLTVVEDGAERVVDGRHKLWAYKELGIKEVPTVVAQSPKPTPTVEKPSKPKGSLKPLGTKADVSLVYPDTKDLPEEQKQYMPTERIKLDLTTTRGNKVVVKDGQDAVMPIINMAIKEARQNKEQDKLVQFTQLKRAHKEGANWSEKDSMDVSEYLTGKREKLTIKGFDKPTDTKDLTSSEVQSVTGQDMPWNRAAIKTLIETHPKLKENPVMTYREIDGEAYLVYKDDNWDSKVRADKLGISKERLEAAGIKDGTTVDLSGALGTTNKVPAINKGGKNYDLMPNKTETKSMKREKYARSKTPEDLKKLINDLNKAGQKNAIARRGQLKSKKAAGSFTHYPDTPKGSKNQGKEVIKLQDQVILDPAHYVTTLAHELAHAIEWQVTGFTGKKTYEMLGAKTEKEKATMKKELKAIVDNLESESVVAENPKYYYSATEMWARYVETWIMEETNARELAPNVTKAFEQLITTEQAVKDLFDAIEGNLDKGWKSYTPGLLMDKRQTYRAALKSKVAGDAAYEAEVVRRAEVQRAEILVKDLIKRKFKGVKDSPALLMQAAEAIRIDQSNGETLYGTTDYRRVRADDKAGIDKYTEAGFKPVGKGVDKNGKPEIVFAKVRYTPEQAKEIMDQLTPEGRKLIEDFNAAKEDAKDEFNREWQKDLYKIEANIEGWVHRGLQEKQKGRMKLGNKSKSDLRKGQAGMTKQRTSIEGNEVKDFREQMEKALMDAKVTDINNKFILRQMARISKPLAKGQRPDDGWVKVEYDPKYGLLLPGENKETMTIQKVMLTEDEFMDATGEEIISQKTFKKPRHEYQVPAALAEHYKNIRHVPQDITRLARFLNFTGKFWAINVLTHVGTTSTNFISGGLQYSGKLFNDFYLDLLPGGNHTFAQTRSNLTAPIVALTPAGWVKAPGWIWGGYRSTQAGSMASKTDKGLEKYGNAVLHLFASVETYWKRTIALSEGINMPTGQIKKEMQELTKLEKQIIAQINKPIDLVALDYDNAPLWLANFEQHGGKLVKPFIAYPYKYTKMIADYMAGPFDQSLTWQQRTAKGLALGSIITIITLWMQAGDDESETPEGTAKTPYQLKPGGRSFFGKDGKGRELFVRTAKYPFFNYTSLGRTMVEGKFGESSALLREMYGTTGLGLDLFDIARGQKSQFDTYKEPGVILAETLTTLIPGFRMLGDVGKIIDPTSRQAKTPWQAVGQTLPVWGDEETLKKWRGNPRELEIPVEPVEGRSLTEKTANTRTIELERADIIRSMLSGIYVSRIDPKEANSQQLRELRNAAESEIRGLLEVDPDSQEAQDKAEKAGLTIPNKTLQYYRAELRKKN